jgi:CHAT domain-containing protein
VQTLVLGGAFRRLLVVPDGPLGLLPFEALVVEPGDDPKYLLDAGPPVVYCPSATLLYNLFQRPTAKPTREAFLSVGDPAYPQGDLVAQRGGGAAVKARYGSGGGRLARLPFTRQEVEWLAKNAADHKSSVARLLGTDATEAAVRAGAPGRLVVHLACHGLTDPGHGNFFGALALTPGPKVDTDDSDDGFLTLTEIYKLNLKGCELAILSACETNFGPQQKGEGVLAISRGFLIAGAKRVVASNWLVDDEAAATLVSAFCGRALDPPKRIEPTPEQAAKGAKPYMRVVLVSDALHDAKRYIRKQDRWKAPYYWASLVLVGPP